MIFIKGGCFEMGDRFGDGESDEKPVHDVCVDDFNMGRYEVTQREWKDVMGNNPSFFFRNCDTCPVEQVSWHDVQDFLSRLNQMTGEKYRLPTEAEWEYAARSGGKKEKWAGISNTSELAGYMWYDKNSGGKTQPVGQKKPNGLGLYDMCGNVWEWVSDSYNENYYENSFEMNPKGPSGGEYRVLRGGSWFNKPRFLRTSNRIRYAPAIRDFHIGFRLVSPAR